MLYRLWLECGLFYKDGSRAIPNNLENKKKMEWTFARSSTANITFWARIWAANQGNSSLGEASMTRVRHPGKWPQFLLTHLPISSAPCQARETHDETRKQLRDVEIMLSAYQLILFPLSPSWKRKIGTSGQLRAWIKASCHYVMANPASQRQR